MAWPIVLCRPLAYRQPVEDLCADRASSELLGERQAIGWVLREALHDCVERLLLDHPVKHTIERP
jgi:hypothetical protein